MDGKKCSASGAGIWTHCLWHKILVSFKLNEKMVLSLDKSIFYGIIILLQSIYMQRWRNRQTRTFEGRVEQSMGVQVPSFAPKSGKKTCLR